MSRRPIFGSRLYGQIVYPLLAASIAVGIVATLVAVYFLGDLTDTWVEHVAESSTSNLIRRYAEYSDQMQSIAKYAASGPTMRRAASTADTSGMRQMMELQSSVLEYDATMVLDGQGRIVAVSDKVGFGLGDRPFGDAGAFSVGRARRGLFEARGHSMLVAFQPVESSGSSYTVAIVRVLDDELLSELGVAGEDFFCFYTEGGRRVGCASGPELKAESAQGLTAATRRPTSQIQEALGIARSKGVGTSSIRVGSDSYKVWAERVEMPGPLGDQPQGYLVGIISQGVSQEAGRTTTNLIMMWSVVAVVALVGLGGWVARRVSDPLVELSAGVRRIADGDYETKVRVEGVNEVSELAETFNVMTDSLRERSESLTKKVLELATLYEMSRALGSTLDLDDLLGSVLDSALRIFDLDLGYVALREKETGAIDIRAIRGTTRSDSDIAVRSSMSEWVVREGRPLIFNPDSSARSQQIDTVTGAKAALCVPLVSPEGTIGAVTIGSSDIEYRFNSDDVRLLSTIANHVTIAIGNIELFTSLQEAYLATVRSLAAAVDAKDTYTRGHSDRVATYSTLIAERMGLAHEQRIALEMAAYLHDIGKIGVKEEILLKPGRLDDAEMAQMRHHPLIGANILKPVAFPWAITPVVRHHHEAYDGSGYPAGLKAEEIPLLARILTVADAFEAMTADRPYRKGRSASDALVELERCAGTQFDPRIVEVFAEIIEELERDGEGASPEIAEDIMPEEARAIFAALVDGLFGSFRRLGGPRLASNIETEVDDYFTSGAMPFRIVRGRLQFLDDVPKMVDGEVTQMKTALRRIDAIMSRVSGGTLVQHFYVDAFSSFSGRMRYLARALDFYDEN